MFCSISRSKNPSDRSTAAYKVKPRRLNCSQNCCKPEGSTGSQDEGPKCSNVQGKCSKRFHTPARSVNHFNHPNSYPSQALESLPIYPSREPVSPQNIAQLVLVRPQGAEKEYTDKECIFQGAYGLGLFPLDPELRWVEKNPHREYLFQCHVRHPLRDTETQRPVPGSSSIFHFIHEGVTRCCKRGCDTEECPGCEPPSRLAHEYLVPGSSLMFHATNGPKPRGSMEVQASGRRGAGGMSKGDDGQDTVVEAIPRSKASTTESNRRSSSRDRPSNALQTDPFKHLYTELDSDTPSTAGKPPRASTKLKVYSQDSYLQNYSVRVMEDRTELLPQGNPIRSTRFHHSRQDPLGRGWATEKEARDFGSRPNGWSRGRLESDIVRELHTNSMHFFRQNYGGLQPGTNGMNIMTVNHLDERFAKTWEQCPYNDFASFFPGMSAKVRGLIWEDLKKEYVGPPSYEPLSQSIPLRAKAHEASNTPSSRRSASATPPSPVPDDSEVSDSSPPNSTQTLRTAYSPLLTTSGAESLPYSRIRPLPPTLQNVYGPQSQLSSAFRTSNGPPSLRTVKPHVRFVLPKRREDGHGPRVVEDDPEKALDE